MLNERRQAILKSIEEQGKLTPELEGKIAACVKLQELEDLYLPFRPKKRTRATVARERGLEPLADMILAQEAVDGTAETLAAEFLNAEKEVNSPEEALAGARDIVAEVISEDAEIRKAVRQFTRRSGILRAEAKDASARSAFEMYYDYSEAVKKIVPHRILALNRGEKEKILHVHIEMETPAALDLIRRAYLKNKASVFADQMEAAMADAFKRLIFPSIERDIRRELTEKADEHAIGVFATNLRNLLLQPPLKDKIIMGIDPGFRTGCKVAVIDETGKYLEGDTIFPHPPQNKIFESKSLLRRLIDKYHVDVISIGNGTASRETETLVAGLIKEIKESGGRAVSYTIVNEAGASIYSASPVAREEFPELEASMRGNISIARRLMDPLEELVKIEPKHIGVGLYQHDVNQRRLEESLDAVVESAVNAVGVDLNTASVSLLKHVLGLTARSAANIVKFRDEHGKFRNREQMKEVAGIGEVAYQQAAGFLRIADGDNPLDNTAIHPESYDATFKLLAKFEVEKNPAEWPRIAGRISAAAEELPKLAAEIGVGEPTLEDILTNLKKPGRDPREDMPKPIFKTDVLKMEDLKVGMRLKGTVRNVVDFGAFVDVGVKRDGLVHVSRMAEKFVKNPHKIVSVGDVVDVTVIAVDQERGRIQLSMRKE